MRRDSRRQFLRDSAALALGSAVLCDGGIESVEAAVHRVEHTPVDKLAADEDFWFRLQQAFTVDRSLVNLNNGGISPSPRVVQDAMRRYLEFANNAPTRNLWLVQDPQVETVRRQLATVFQCDAEEVAITRNASEALQTCQYGFDLRPGDEILTTELDYPRMITTFQQRECREAVKLVLAPVRVPVQSADDVVETYRRHLTPRTRLILVSHVVFVTGQINPVREICALGRERDIPVIVDGAHAFAHIADSVAPRLDCEYYGTSLHKWLTAPHGTGMLYVRRQRIAGLWPLMAAPYEKTADIRKFEEIGTHPAANKLAISEAIALHRAIGPERKEARLRYLRDRWAKRLTQDSRVRLYTQLDPRHGAGIATFLIEGVDPQLLTEHLWDRHKIIVVSIDYANVQGVRVSPNVYTTLDEIDMFCAAVEDVLARGLPA